MADYKPTQNDEAQFQEDRKKFHTPMELMKAVTKDAMFSKPIATSTVVTALLIELKIPHCYFEEKGGIVVQSYARLSAEKSHIIRQP